VDGEKAWVATTRNPAATARVALVTKDVLIEQRLLSSVLTP
jgi:hypothetical protein